METRADYLSHISIVKDMYTNKDGSLKNSTKEFEEVYEKVQNADLKLSTAKEFLNSLSKEEKRAIKEYQGFAQDMDISKLTDEGAYNALVHKYEQYDFDNDGHMMVGEATSIAHIPQNMEPKAKKALAEVYNEATTLEEKSSISFMMMTLDMDRILKDIAEYLTTLPSSELTEIEKQWGFDINEFISQYKNYQPKMISYDDVMAHIERIAKDNETKYPETTASMQRLSTSFKSHYEDIKEQNAKVAKTDEVLNSIINNS